MNEPRNPCPNPFPAAGRSRAGASGRARGQAGFTLLETAIASALLVLFLTSLFALNSTVMRMLRSANETAAASQEIQTRIEQVRSANWTQMCQSGTPADMAGTVCAILDIRTQSLLDLPGATESIQAIRYVEPLTFDASGNVVLPAASFTVARDGTGVITVRDVNGAAPGATISLSTEDKFFVRVVVNWTSWGGRPRSRELVTLVSRWGISK